MKGLFRKRGGGKTTALVYASAITGYPIVVPTTINKRYVKDVARRAGVSIPEPAAPLQYHLGQGAKERISQRQENAA